MKFLSRILFLFKGKELIVNKLYWMLAIFLSTMVVLLFIDNYFDQNYILNYQEKTHNQEQQQKLDVLLQSYLLRLNIEFNNYRSVRSQEQLLKTKKNIEAMLSQSEQIATVIYRGGIVNDVKQINYFGQDEIVEIFEYQPDDFTRSVKELDDLLPKLQELRQLSVKLFDLQEPHIGEENGGGGLNTGSIDFYLSQSEKQFSRMSEIQNRISYAINKRYQYLSNSNISIIQIYSQLKYLSVVVFFFVVTIIFYFLVTQIKNILLQRRKVEASNQLLSQAIDQTPISIMIADTRGNIEYVNKGMERISGFTLDDIKEAEVFGDKSDHTGELNNILLQTIQDGKIWHGEMNSVRKDGSDMVEKVIISPVMSSRSTISNYLIIKEDVTEKMHLSASLRDSLESMSLITENLPVGVLLTDETHQVLQLNDTAAKLMGFKSVDDALKKINMKGYDGVFEVIRSDKYSDPVSGILVDSQEVRMIINENNISRSVLKNIIPIKIDNKNVLLEAFMDITAQKEVQARADESNRAKSEFLANMSHEIRTPMNGIVGATDLLSKTTLDNDQEKIINIISKSCDTLLIIVNDILDFSKIEAGKMTIENHPFNLRSSIDYVMDQVSFRAYSKSLELISFVEETIPGVLIGDEGRLIQILINLLGNSVKFTEEGEVFLSAEVESMAGNQVSVHFKIEDSGIGIEKDKLELIFESFTQADGSTTRRYGGTGLGTSIARMLVELMGGRIWVESPNPNFSWSKDAPGSVFHVVLPFIIEREDILPIWKMQNFSHIKALIADSHPNTVSSLSKTLGTWGINSGDVDRISALLSYLKEHSDTNLLILNPALLHSSSEQLIVEIKNIVPSIKIILFSPENRLMAENAFLGIDKILKKPIKYMTLYSTLEELFGVFSPKQAASDNNAMERLKGCMVLLVEDNLINQKIAEKMLGRIGLDVEIVTNGQEAIDWMTENKEKVHLILMDIQMPVMNGLDATRELRKMNIDTPIVALTANALKGDRDICIEAGMNDYVGKPFKLDDLTSVILKWI